MKPFRFTLEAVAIVRTRNENEALAAYARALLCRQRALDQVDAIRRELEAAWARARRDLAAGCPAAKMAQGCRHTQALEDEQVRLTDALQQAERAVNQMLQRMLAARQQREVVDKLRGHQRARHERDVARETQKILDELALRAATPALAGRSTADLLA